MPSPDTSSLASPDEVLWCSEMDCERPAVISSVVCRIHLVDVLGFEGRMTPFEDLELSGIWAAAVHILSVVLSDLPAEDLEPDAPWVRASVAALVDGTVDGGLAQLVLDLLATQVADEFGMMSMDPPMEHEGNTLLVYRTAVPLSVPYRLQTATALVLLEILGEDALIGVLAQPATGSAGVA
jgi:hypothetical protein